MRRRPRYARARTCARLLPPIAVAALLASCAAPVKVAPPPVVATLPPPPPELPRGAYAGMKIAAKRADGRYVTPNIDMTAAAAVWHLRGALNVAALACDKAGGPYVTAYNGWIVARRAVLDGHVRQYTREWEQTGWADWRDAYDNQQTRLYNFYTQPAIHDGFCAVALEELGTIATVTDADLPTHARGALARLDAPFIAFFTAYDRWQDYYADRVRPAAPPVVATLVTPPAAVAVAPAPATPPAATTPTLTVAPGALD